MLYCCKCVHSFGKYKKHLLLSAENNSTLDYVIMLQMRYAYMHLLSNNYLVNQTNNKGNNFTASITSYVNSTIHPEIINNRLASQLNIDGSIALIKVPVGSKSNNQSLHPFEHHPTSKPSTLLTTTKHKHYTSQICAYILNTPITNRESREPL